MSRSIAARSALLCLALCGLIGTAPAGAQARSSHSAPSHHAAAPQSSPAPQAAAAPRSTAPQKIGSFADWTAAQHQENGQKVCYAFTRATRAEGNRQNVLLIVTERPQGRDQVAVQAGYRFPRNAELTLSVGSNGLPFYTAGSDAFARDGRAAVAAMRNGHEATTKGPGPDGRGTRSDAFSLNGFTAAHDAITKECPAGRG